MAGDNVAGGEIRLADPGRSSLHPSSFILHPSPRSAFTLTELLIVIAIMVVVAAFLIPAVRPALQDRKIRESARMINVYFAAAQARAIEKRRLVGVWLERNPNNNNECIQLYMAETPPPYSGDTLGALVDATGSFRASPLLGCTGTAMFRGNCSMLATQVKQGDLIKFDYKGPYYTLTSDPIPATTPYVFQINFAHASAPPPRGTLGVPYQIDRQPRRISGTTFALPTKTCINLYFSGGGAGGFGPPATGGGGVVPNIPPWGPGMDSTPDMEPLVVCFGPSGRLDRAYARDPNDIIMLPPPPAGPGGPKHNMPRGRWKSIPATEALYLFVARNDRDGIAADDFRNLEDPANLWVTVGHRTGMTATVENVNTATPAFPSGTAAQNMAKVMEARRLAREKTGMGGR